MPWQTIFYQLSSQMLNFGSCPCNGVWKSPFRIRSRLIERRERLATDPPVGCNRDGQDEA